MDLVAEIGARIDLYAKNQVELTEKAAEMEIIADYVGDKLLSSEQEIVALVRADMNLGQKILTFIEDVMTMIKGTAAEKHLMEARRIYRKALREAEVSGTALKAQPQYDVKIDPKAHGAEQQKIIGEYNAAVDENLVKFVKNAAELPPKIKYELKPVSNRAAGDIQALLGIDAKGFRTVIEPRAAVHILNRHGEEGNADQSLSDVNDIARMQYVIDHYDGMVYGGKSKAHKVMGEDGKNRLADTVIYYKKINGTYYVVGGGSRHKGENCQYCNRIYIKKRRSTVRQCGFPRR